MTRRSITTVLGSLLVALLLVVNIPAVSAEGSCNAADAGTIDQCVELAANIAASGVSGVNQRLCSQPSVGFPTCYTLQVNGTWVREDQDIAASGLSLGWVVVGTATLDEVLAAVPGAPAHIFLGKGMPDTAEGTIIQNP